VLDFEAGGHRQLYRAVRLPLYPKKEWEFEVEGGG